MCQALWLMKARPFELGWDPAPNLSLLTGDEGSGERMGGRLRAQASGVDTENLSMSNFLTLEKES